MQENKNSFVGYEYKTFTVPAQKASQFIDCYESFGWELDENIPPATGYGSSILKMKRNRKIINKMELTRLQRHFESCANEIETLEKNKVTMPTMWAIIVGVIGTVFMAGFTFSIVHEPPIVWLGIPLAIPGFIGWIFPYFIFIKMQQKQTEKIQPFIEAKIEEIYKICEKGYSLL
ncbi:MAG: hypothetical protein IJ439_03320 [Tyzzerella sp.]|nr:hypothetical protein [Tyzzerella sp.]